MSNTLQNITLLYIIRQSRELEQLLGRFSAFHCRAYKQFTASILLVGFAALQQDCYKEVSVFLDAHRTTIFAGNDLVADYKQSSPVSVSCMTPVRILTRVSNVHYKQTNKKLPRAVAVGLARNAHLNVCQVVFFGPLSSTKAILESLPAPENLSANEISRVPMR